MGWYIRLERTPPKQPPTHPTLPPTPTPPIIYLFVVEHSVCLKGYFTDLH